MNDDAKRRRSTLESRLHFMISLTQNRRPTIHIVCGASRTLAA